jgi:aminopeptidase N
MFKQMYNSAIAQVLFTVLILLNTSVLFAQKYSRADSLRGCASSYREAIDIISYDLNIKLNIENKFIEGHNDIIFRANANTKEIQLDLFENMKILDVSKGNTPLNFRREFNAFFVSFPEAIIKGQVYKIRVKYNGNPTAANNPPWDGGLIWRTTPQGKPWIGVACEGIGASLWWPNKDHLSDEPDSMWIRVAVPDSLQNISNGQLKDKVKLSGGYTRWDWFVSYPINNYNVTLNVGDYAHFSDIHINGNDTLKMDYYVLPENLEKAKIQFQQAKKTIEAFEFYFGKYPFYRDGYKLIETPYAGMEHQSAIAYGNKYLPGYWGRHLPGIDFDYIIIHETGHEWWGNKVSVKDVADLWVHEGFCTYSEVLYVEYTLGKEAAERYAFNMRKRIRNDKPIIGDYEVNNEGSGDMYNKGAVMLHTLRKYLNNDPLFFSILKGIQTEFAYETVTTKQIENYIAAKAGLDLKAFFEQYLRKSWKPIFEYYFEGKGKEAKLVYRWNAEKGFELPIYVTTEKGKYTELKPLHLNQNIAIKIKPKKFKIDETTGYFDYENMRK